LLIACANVAGMQLARSEARQREIGVRLSLGASRARLIRQLLTESALLGFAAGGISMALSYWALRFIVVQASVAMPIEWGTFALHIAPDRTIFVYVFLMSLFASVLFGLAPALECSRPDLTSALKEEGARFAWRLGNRRLRDVLMACQVGICLFLLVLAGLLIHSSARALSMQTGYEAKHVLELEVSFPPGLGYAHGKQIAELRQIAASLRSLPGVSGVSFGHSPDNGGLRTARVGADRTLFYTFVQTDYFDILDIPLLAGRGFDRQGGSADTVVLSESAARSLWPKGDAIGHSISLDISDQFHLDGEIAPERHGYLIVGIARDTRGVLLDGSDSEKAYLALPPDQLDQAPMLLRARTDPMALVHSAATVIHRVDPNAIAHAITLEDALSNSPQFVVARCSGLFASVIGLLGLLLASAGIYGSVSYAVVRRTREVGIRIALGANRGQVIRMVLSETARPVVGGLLVGLIAAAAGAQLMRALLSGVSPLDPAAFLGITIFFLGVALLAAFVPARRALRIDPMAALRCE
jgi:predicted permease